MEWLEPWCSVMQMGEQIAQSWQRQLQIEVLPGHSLFGKPVKLLARGNGDDALFEILDGSGRVANVHLTWSKSQERLPWPRTDIYSGLQDWGERVMVPEHQEWVN
ncbi:hypothetical protein [Pelobacter seleniigenes]|uniref:hypothetical protein n=1 Tax=Pelobacter seleniigenes TaxID=407188 RepID=UPI0004A6F00E|nr:hypothetical protein [Pelobacter seleniigenes]